MHRKGVVVVVRGEGGEGHPPHARCRLSLVYARRR